MAGISVPELILRIRELADMRDSQFYSDDEITRVIEQKYQKLWRECVIQNEDFFIVDYEYDPVSGGLGPFDKNGRLGFDTLTDPDTEQIVAVWKHIDIQCNIESGVGQSLKRVEYKDRHRYGFSNDSPSSTSPLYYYIHQSNLHTLPAAVSSVSYRWSIVPLPFAAVPALEASSVLPLWAGWEDVIANDCCAALWNAQQWDPSFFMAEAAAGLASVLSTMKPRDMGEPRRTIVEGAGFGAGDVDDYYGMGF